MKDLLYFDNAATTFPKPEIVYQTIDKVNRQFAVNAGRGTYYLADKASALIDETRKCVSDLTKHGNPENIILTPSATIALNIVLFGRSWQRREAVYYSPFEHNSVLRPLNELRKRFDLELIEIPFTPLLDIDWDKLNKMFNTIKPGYVVCCHGSNVCGKVFPIEKLTRIAQQYEATTLVDGSQTFGIIPVNLNELACDYYVFAGHKGPYGPIGVGGIIINTNQEIIEPLIYGGTGSNSEELFMPDSYPLHLEAGSPNVVAIAGLNAGLKWVNEQLDLFDQEMIITQEFINIVREFPHIELVGVTNSEVDLPVVSCTFSGYTPQQIASWLSNEYNIAVRAGLHCAPLAHKFLGTNGLGTVRFSFSNFNSVEELQILKNIFGNL